MMIMIECFSVVKVVMLYVSPFLVFDFGLIMQNYLQLRPSNKVASVFIFSLVNTWFPCNSKMMAS